MDIPSAMIVAISEEMHREKSRSASDHEWIKALKREAALSMIEATRKPLEDLLCELDQYLDGRANEMEALEEIVLAARLLRRSGNMEAVTTPKG